MMFNLFCIHHVFIQDVLANPNISGTYLLQTSKSELEIEKKRALERTVQSADWLYQIPISIRLKDKPHICETYVFEVRENSFQVTCDSLETLIIPISGVREKVKRTINGKPSEIEVQFYNKENHGVAYEIISGGGSMYINIQKSDDPRDISRNLTISKSIKSSYFTIPYTVEMTYLSQ